MQLIFYLEFLDHFSLSFCISVVTACMLFTCMPSELLQFAHMCASLSFNFQFCSFFAKWFFLLHNLYFVYISHNLLHFVSSFISGWTSICLVLVCSLLTDFVHVFIHWVLWISTYILSFLLSWHSIVLQIFIAPLPATCKKNGTLHILDLAVPLALRN